MPSMPATPEPAADPITVNPVTANRITASPAVASRAAVKIQPTVNREPAEHEQPGEHECLRCYLMRMLDESGCDGSHRWTLQWRKTRAPRASGLVSRLQRQGGYCDCEVIFNTMPDYPEVDEILPCAGVPEGSTRPCNLTGAAGSVCLV